MISFKIGVFMSAGVTLGRQIFMCRLVERTGKVTFLAPGGCETGVFFQLEWSPSPF